MHLYLPSMMTRLIMFYILGYSRCSYIWMTIHIMGRNNRINSVLWKFVLKAKCSYKMSSYKISINWCTILKQLFSPNRHVFDDGTDEYKIIMLNKRYLGFRIVKVKISFFVSFYNIIIFNIIITIIITLSNMVVDWRID